MGTFCLSGHICHSGEYCSKYLHPKHWQKWSAVVAISVCKVTNVAGILELSVADFRYRNERKGGMRACHGQEFKKIVQKLLWVLYFKVCCYDAFRKYSGTQGVHQSREWVLAVCTFFYPLKRWQEKFYPCSEMLFRHWRIKSDHIWISSVQKTAANFPKETNPTYQFTKFSMRMCIYLIG